MEPSNVLSRKPNIENIKHTSPDRLRRQRSLETRRVLKQTHWTFDRSLKTRVNQKRHERHKVQAKHVPYNTHQRKHKLRSSKECTQSVQTQNKPKSYDEQKTEHEMEQNREEELQVSTHEEKEACSSEIGLDSTYSRSLHNDATQCTLSSTISEVRQTIRDALVFGKRYLNVRSNLNKAEIISVAEDHKSETKENEITLFRATAQYNECRFQKYNKRIDEELEQWIIRNRQNAHKTSSNVSFGRKESTQTEGETHEDLREQKAADDDSQEPWEVDDAWMDEYRNPFFDEYNRAATSRLHQEPNSHSNNIQSTSEAGVDVQVDDSCNALTNTRNTSCTHELREARDCDSTLDSDESSSVSLEPAQTMSISRIKFLQDLMLEAMEQSHKERRFRATPVPTSTSRPRYDNLMIEQDLRRFINKQEAMELLQELQKPFSFDSKAQQTRPHIPNNKISNKKQLFIAKEVPSHVKQMRYTLLLEQEALRKVEIQKQAKLKLESAKMPPRMELHPKRSQKEEPVHNQPEEEMETRSPGFIPDFKSLHTQWKKRLQRSRASNQRKLTVPMAFNMERRPKRHSSFYQFSKAPTPDSCVPNERPTSSTGLRNCSTKNTQDVIQEKKAMPNGIEQQVKGAKQKTKRNKMKRSKVPRTELQMPLQYVKARYKQIETQAKEIVAEVLKAQGLDFHKYITF